MKVSNPLLFSSQVNNPPRNAFDLSYHSYFTSPAGLLLPNFVLDVSPGDAIDLDVKCFSRTQPVKTAAFCRIGESTDFYFVPYRLLWRWFDPFFSSLTVQDSSYSPISGVPTQVPYVTGQVLSD